MTESNRATLRPDSQMPCPQPASILAQEEFNSLERWLYSEAAGGLSLREVEMGEEVRGREVLRLLLQAHVECRGDGDVGPAIEVVEGGNGREVVAYSHKRTHSRDLFTIFGPIRIAREGYAMDGKASIHPLDEELELPSRVYSYELQRRLVKKIVQGPFDEAIEAVYEQTGVRVPKRSAEQILMDASVDFDSFYAQRQGNAALETGPILVGSVDCKGIPMVKPEPAPKTVRRRKGQKAQKKKMATVATVFTIRPRVRTPQEVVESLFGPKKKDKKKGKAGPRPERKRVWASLVAGKDAVIMAVKEEMNRRDPFAEKLHIVLTDGERALQHRVCRIMKRRVILILDFLHVLERLWEAGHALYGEGSRKAEKFVRDRALRILRGQVSQVVKGLKLIVTRRQLKGKKKKKLLEAANYYYRNRGRMRYDEYLALGLHIASGPVEGACKNLIKDRMERSGMRWSEITAEAMVRMRSAYLSGDLDEYWEYHIRQDQQRLYPKGRWQPMIRVVPK